MPSQETFFNESGLDLDELIELAKLFLPHAQKTMGFESAPPITFLSDKENSLNPLGKTAYYDPSEISITLFVDNRHPKDILRSMSHELVHHAQNGRGMFDNIDALGAGYAQSDDHMREMEREAYETGNLCFRDWEDEYKQKQEWRLVESARAKLQQEGWRDAVASAQSGLSGAWEKARDVETYKAAARSAGEQTKGAWNKATAVKQEDPDAFAKRMKGAGKQTAFSPGRGLHVTDDSGKSTHRFAKTKEGEPRILGRDPQREKQPHYTEQDPSPVDGMPGRKGTVNEWTNWIFAHEGQESIDKAYYTMLYSDAITIDKKMSVYAEYSPKYMQMFGVVPTAEPPEAELDSDPTGDPGPDPTGDPGPDPLPAGEPEPEPLPAVEPGDFGSEFAGFDGPMGPKEWLVTAVSSGSREGGPDEGSTWNPYWELPNEVRAMMNNAEEWGVDTSRTSIQDRDGNEVDPSEYVGWAPRGAQAEEAPEEETFGGEGATSAFRDEQDDEAIAAEEADWGGGGDWGGFGESLSFDEELRIRSAIHKSMNVLAETKRAHHQQAEIYKQKLNEKANNLYKEVSAAGKLLTNNEIANFSRLIGSSAPQQLLHESKKTNLFEQDEQLFLKEDWMTDLPWVYHPPTAEPKADEEVPGLEDLPGKWLQQSMGELFVDDADQRREAYAAELELQKLTDSNVSQESIDKFIDGQSSGDMSDYLRNRLHGVVPKGGYDPSWSAKRTYGTEAQIQDRLNSIEGAFTEQGIDKAEMKKRLTVARGVLEQPKIDFETPSSYDWVEDLKTGGLMDPINWMEGRQNPKNRDREFYDRIEEAEDIPDYHERLDKWNENSRTSGTPQPTYVSFSNFRSRQGFNTAEEALQAATDRGLDYTDFDPDGCVRGGKFNVLSCNHQKDEKYFYDNLQDVQGESAAAKRARALSHYRNYRLDVDHYAAQTSVGRMSRAEKLMLNNWMQKHTYDIDRRSWHKYENATGEDGNDWLWADKESGILLRRKQYEELAERVRQDLGPDGVPKNEIISILQDPERRGDVDIKNICYDSPERCEGNMLQDYTNLPLGAARASNGDKFLRDADHYRQHSISDMSRARWTGAVRSYERAMQHFSPGYKTGNQLLDPNFVDRSTGNWTMSGKGRSFWQRAERPGGVSTSTGVALGAPRQEAEQLPKLSPNQIGFGGGWGGAMQDGARGHSLERAKEERMHLTPEAEAKYGWNQGTLGYGEVEDGQWGDGSNPIVGPGEGLYGAHPGLDVHKGGWTAGAPEDAREKGLTAGRGSGIDGIRFNVDTAGSQYPQAMIAMETLLKPWMAADDIADSARMLDAPIHMPMYVHLNADDAHFATIENSDPGTFGPMGWEKPELWGRAEVQIPVGGNSIETPRDWAETITEVNNGGLWPLLATNPNTARERIIDSMARTDGSLLRQTSQFGVDPRDWSKLDDSQTSQYATRVEQTWGLPGNEDWQKGLNELAEETYGRGFMDLGKDQRRDVLRATQVPYVSNDERLRDMARNQQIWFNENCRSRGAEDDGCVDELLSEFANMEVAGEIPNYINADPSAAYTDRLHAVFYSPNMDEKKRTDFFDSIAATRGAPGGTDWLMKLSQLASSPNAEDRALRNKIEYVMRTDTETKRYGSPIPVGQKYAAAAEGRIIEESPRSMSETMRQLSLNNPKFVTELEDLDRVLVTGIVKQSMASKALSALEGNTSYEAYLLAGQQGEEVNSALLTSAQEAQHNACSLYNNEGCVVNAGAKPKDGSGKPMYRPWDIKRDLLSENGWANVVSAHGARSRYFNGDQKAVINYLSTAYSLYGPQAVTIFDTIRNTQDWGNKAGLGKAGYGLGGHSPELDLMIRRMMPLGPPTPGMGGPMGRLRPPAGASKLPAGVDVPGPTMQYRTPGRAGKTPKWWRPGREAIPPGEWKPDAGQPMKVGGRPDPADMGYKPGMRASEEGPRLQRYRKELGLDRETLTAQGKIGADDPLPPLPDPRPSAWQQPGKPAGGPRTTRVGSGAGQLPDGSLSALPGTTPTAPILNPFAILASPEIYYGIGPARAWSNAWRDIGMTAPPEGVGGAPTAYSRQVRDPEGNIQDDLLLEPYYQLLSQLDPKGKRKYVRYNTGWQSDTSNRPDDEDGFPTTEEIDVSEGSLLEMAQSQASDPSHKEAYVHWLIGQPDIMTDEYITSKATHVGEFEGPVGSSAGSPSLLAVQGGQEGATMTTRVEQLVKDGILTEERGEQLLTSREEDRWRLHGGGGWTHRDYQGRTRPAAFVLTGSEYMKAIRKYGDPIYAVQIDPDGSGDEGGPNKPIVTWALKTENPSFGKTDSEDFWGSPSSIRSEEMAKGGTYFQQNQWLQLWRGQTAMEGVFRDPDLDGPALWHAMSQDPKYQASMARFHPGLFQQHLNAQRLSAPLCDNLPAWQQGTGAPCSNGGSEEIFAMLDVADANEASKTMPGDTGLPQGTAGTTIRSKPDSWPDIPGKLTKEAIVSSMNQENEIQKAGARWHRWYIEKPGSPGTYISMPMRAGGTRQSALEHLVDKTTRDGQSWLFDQISEETNTPLDELVVETAGTLIPTPAGRKELRRYLERVREDLHGEADAGQIEEQRIKTFIYGNMELIKEEVTKQFSNKQVSADVELIKNIIKDQITKIL